MSIWPMPADAVTGGSPIPADSWNFVARVDVNGVHGCSGALVAPQWILTAANCYAVDGQDVGSNSLAGLPTTVTIGGTGLPVVHLVPDADRGVVLAELALRVPDITPVAVSSTAPAAGDAVQAAGYGRTATAWVPDQPQAAAVTVDAVSAESFGWTGPEASACQGDAGGPVFRTGGARPELVGIDIASRQGGCLDQNGSQQGATAARVDDLRNWISGATTDLSASFRSYHTSSTGLAEYDLADARDQVVPFDYDHTGKLDHLVVYRPGEGIVHIVKHNADDTYRSIVKSTGGIGGFSLRNGSDRIVPFDYDHTGKLDHLLLYRPGSGVAWVVAHGEGTAFTAVVTSSTGIGGYDLADTRDQLLAFDYDHSGKPDHLVAYRPGDGIVHIVKHGAGTSFSSIVTSTGGIGGYDLRGTTDRIVAFDYAHSGKLDHLVLYRPGGRTAWIVAHGEGTTFTAVYSNHTTGIGGYDLAETRDQILAFDYGYSGRLDHLVLYRPGAGIIHILQHGADNSFTPVFTSTTGIAGYGLGGAMDRIVAFDPDHSGGPNHLVLYRPGGRIASVVGRQGPTAVAVAIPRPVSVEDSIVETFSYPNAAHILATLHVRLISGDGHLLLADCTTPPVNNVGVIHVWTTEQIGPEDAGHVCFQVLGPAGRLDLEVPGVYSIRGDGQQRGYGHRLTAVVDTETGSPVTVEVDPSGYAPVGIGADPANEPTTLLQLRAGQ
ncbi:S1 family peptidase [Mangrovihabitans endophyticus]|nr:trypsin-like serine protease [Mangrovihabitans endophyticus]